MAGACGTRGRIRGTHGYRPRDTPSPTRRVLTVRFGLDRHRHGEVEAGWSRSAGAWTFAWTDGPTVARVRAACRESGPEPVCGLRYVRTLSEDAVALGTVRLTVAPADGTGRRSPVQPADVEALWADEPFTAPRSERERALVYAVVYEAHEARRRNRAEAEEICALVNQYGLAVFLRRRGAASSPVEILTARYAATHAHPAWCHRRPRWRRTCWSGRSGRSGRSGPTRGRRRNSSPPRSPSCPACPACPPRPTTGPGPSSGPVPGVPRLRLDPRAALSHPRRTLPS